MIRVRWWSAILAIVASTGCGRRVEPEECRQLLDRYTIALLRAEDPRLPGAELDRLRVEAQRHLSARPADANCGGRVSRRAYECAMRAGSPDEIERCLL